MRKLANQIIAVILILTMVPTMCTTTFAAQQNSTLVKIQQLVKKAESERETYGEVTDKTANQLEVALNNLGVETGSYSETQIVVLNNAITTSGYGQTHNLSSRKGRLLAAGIFVIVVGVAFVVPESLPALLAAI